MVIKSKRISDEDNTYAPRHVFGAPRLDTHPKAIKKHNLLTNSFGKLIRQREQDGNVELTARSNEKGKNQIFYVKFPLNLFDMYPADKKIAKIKLDQVEVRLSGETNEFRTLKSLTKPHTGETLADFSSKAILAFAVENVIDEYRRETAPQKLHKPQT